MSDLRIEYTDKKSKTVGDMRDGDVFCQREKSCGVGPETVILCIGRGNFIRLSEAGSAALVRDLSLREETPVVRYDAVLKLTERTCAA